MKKFSLILLMMLLSVSLVLVACDEDDDSDGDSGDGDAADGDDPFADCGGDTSSDPCLQLICAYEQAFTACEEAGTDCSYLLDCVQDLQGCVCPDGEFDATGTQTCVDTYTNCVTEGATAAAGM